MATVKHVTSRRTDVWVEYPVTRDSQYSDGSYRVTMTANGRTLVLVPVASRGPFPEVRMRQEAHGLMAFILCRGSYTARRVR